VSVKESLEYAACRTLAYHPYDLRETNKRARKVRSLLNYIIISGKKRERMKRMATEQENGVSREFQQLILILNSTSRELVF